jgi:hypothetical protein
MKQVTISGIGVVFQFDSKHIVALDQELRKGTEIEQSYLVTRVIAETWVLNRDKVAIDIDFSDTSTVGPSCCHCLCYQLGHVSAETEVISEVVFVEVLR